MKYVLDREKLIKEAEIESPNEKALNVLDSIVPIIVKAYNQGKNGEPLTVYPIMEVK